MAVVQAYVIADSRNVGILPRAEEPNVGGVLVLPTGYEIASGAQAHALGSPYEAGISTSVKTDVL